MANICKTIKQLIDYAVKNGLMTDEDRIFSQSMLIDALGLSEYEEPAVAEEAEIEDILREIDDYAFENGIIDDNGVTARDLFDAKIIGCMSSCPSKSEIICAFQQKSFCERWTKRPVRGVSLI